MNYKELRELIKDKSDDEEVVILAVTDYNEYYTLNGFMFPTGELSLKFDRIEQ